MLKNTFKHRGIKLWKNLYTTYIRPHLEFAIQVWSPHFIKDIEALEKVQQRATKTITELSNFTYEERLRKIGLTTLKDRRIRGDLIENYKSINGLNDINWIQTPIKAVQHSESGPAARLRGHDQKMYAQNCRGCMSRDKFFINRVAGPWNALSQNLINARSLNEFKNRYDDNYNRITCSASIAYNFI